MPALDEIARDPAKTATLTPDAARALYARCAVVLTALLPALSAPGPAEPPALNQERKWLRPREASVRFNVPKRWLLAHAAEIPGTQRLSRKTILFEEIHPEVWRAARMRAVDECVGFQAIVEPALRLSLKMPKEGWR